jgi:hypothetical protein
MQEPNMSYISLQEIMLVTLAAIVIIAYHAHLYTQVRRDLAGAQPGWNQK